ncbi:hypothetical protein GCM10010329_20180 [Streptomyces spiroverticillatus]|uniref:DUF4097 domain-containing protein n=1 Tax=Streptomyces finlayi TaxID=67296 RepID=A0A918WUS8_9ACTN|nr:DUF4097 family beta strand repeat-containing protein [Streptomyces finlayi]GGZ98601.1 hypothetical protein GCM10010329_20180 [Streptomyces spiroverticillatus]GHC83472.1 hypothetical protein GCM10010334_12620 [Streptomyces finlayi]
MPKAGTSDQPHVHRFDTASPVAATVHVEVGTVRVTASDRADSVVTVRPSDSAHAGDVKAAAQTRVECADGFLRVRAPKTRSLFGKSPSLAVEVELPAGSRLEGKGAVTDFDCRGPLAEVRIKTSVGDLRLDRAVSADLTTSHGSVTVEHVEGDADLTTGSGEIHAVRIGGTCDVKNSNGSTRIDDVTGSLTLRIANGRVVVGRAHASVTSRTANGSVRIDEVTRDRTTVETSAGNIEIGIRTGSAAWLDVTSGMGRVYTDLEDSSGPGDAEEAVEIRAHTTMGSITIRRAPA